MNLLLIRRRSGLTNLGKLSGECTSVAHTLLSHDLASTGTDGEWKLAPLVLAIEEAGGVVVASQDMPVIQHKQPVLPTHKPRETEAGIIIELHALNRINSGDPEVRKGMHNSTRGLGDKEGDICGRVLPSQNLLRPFINQPQPPYGQSDAEYNSDPKHQYDFLSHAMSVDGNQGHHKPSSVREGGKSSFRGIGT